MQRRRRHQQRTTHHIAGVTLQRKLVRCSNERCGPCRGGASHGPYYYVFWRADGNAAVRSRYVGAALPELVRRVFAKAPYRVGVVFRNHLEADTAFEEMEKLQAFRPENRGGLMPREERAPSRRGSRARSSMRAAAPRPRSRRP